MSEGRERRERKADLAILQANWENKSPRIRDKLCLKHNDRQNVTVVYWLLLNSCWKNFTIKKIYFYKWWIKWRQENIGSRWVQTGREGVWWERPGWGGKQNERRWEKHLKACCLVIWLKSIRIWRQILHKSRQFWSNSNESLNKNLSTTCWMAP